MVTAVEICLPYLRQKKSNQKYEWLSTRKCYIFLYIKLFKVIVKWTKIHVQIMTFTCCLNMVFNLKILKMSHDLFVWQCTKSVATQTDHYMDVMNASKNVEHELWRGYYVRKFNADAILFGENQYKKNGILRFSSEFLVGVRWNMQE